ncbi:MAG TPA: F0F1 ATP synthase subunit alpha, partial [Burkholderiaceae bacterium]|nr:F0F1 ATP synthase subunit alpha [Burkholderiaceae bacterium]
VAKALDAEKAMRYYLKLHHGALVDRIESTKDLSKDDEAALNEALKAFAASAAY